MRNAQNFVVSSRQDAGPWQGGESVAAPGRVASEFDGEVVIWRSPGRWRSIGSVAERVVSHLAEGRANEVNDDPREPHQEDADEKAVIKAVVVLNDHGIEGNSAPDAIEHTHPLVRLVRAVFWARRIW